MSDLVIEIGDAKFRAMFEKVSHLKPVQHLKQQCLLRVKLFMSDGVGWLFGYR